MIIDSNSNLQENTAENQPLSKIRRNQLVAKLKSKLEFKSRQEVQFPVNPSRDINNLALKKKLKREKVKS